MIVHKVHFVVHRSGIADIISWVAIPLHPVPCSGTSDMARLQPGAWAELWGASRYTSTSQDLKLVQSLFFLCVAAVDMPAPLISKPSAYGS